MLVLVRNVCRQESFNPVMFEDVRESDEDREDVIFTPFPLCAVLQVLSECFGLKLGLLEGNIAGMEPTEF